MLEAMAQAKVTSGSVFTSRFYSTNSTGTRYIDGVDVTSYIINGVGTDATGPVRNDYDRAPFWGEMEDISLPALDASGNTLLDSNNEPIMNEFKAIPNYWVRHTYGTDILGQQYEEFSISTKELYGYTRMKTNKDGSAPSHILVGKYFKTINTNINSGVGKGTCTKGYNPMVSTSIFGTDFCYVKSSRFGADNPTQLKTCTIEEYSNIAYAAIVEFNTRNLSSILPGYLGGSYSGWGYIGAEFQGYNNNNTVDQDYIIVPTNTWNNWASKGAGVGKSLWFYGAESQRYTEYPIVSVTDYLSSGTTVGKKITFDMTPGKPATWFNFGGEHPGEYTGKTDNIAASSGYLTEWTGSSRNSFKYRGLENMWGMFANLTAGYALHMLYETIDGVKTRVRADLVKTDAASAAALAGGDYTTVAEDILPFVNGKSTNVTGYISGENQYGKVLVPAGLVSSGSGPYNTYFGIYNTSQDFYNLVLSGRWYDGTYIGLLFWNVEHSFDGSYYYWSCRPYLSL